MNLQNQLDYLPSLLDGVVVPAPLSADYVKSQIMLECGLLTPLYSEPYLMKMAIAQWFKTHEWTFAHLVKVIQAEYSPIENVDRYDSQSHTIETSESESSSETDTMGRLHHTTGSGLVSSSGGSDEQRSKAEQRSTCQDLARREASAGGEQNSRGMSSGKDGGNDHSLQQAEQKAAGSDHASQDLSYKTTGESHVQTTEEETAKESGVSGLKGTRTENQVSAFDSGSYQPANLTVGSESESELTNGSSSLDRSESGSSRASESDSHSMSEASRSSESDSLSMSENSSFSESESMSESGSSFHSESTSASENVKFSESVSGSESGHATTSESESSSHQTSESESQTTNAHGIRSGHTLTTDMYYQHMHGNIGVTTNQQMINQELDLLERFNVYGWIAKTFRADLILEVY